MVEKQAELTCFKSVGYIGIAAFCCNMTMKAGKMLAPSQRNPVAWHLVVSYSVIKLVGPTVQSVYYTEQDQLRAIIYFYMT
jgi:hypothetical protein